MIRRVLIPFDGSPSSRSALSIACSIAGLVEADLCGLYVEDESRFQDLPLAAAIAENVAGAPIVNQPLPPEKMLEVEEQVGAERESLRIEFQEMCAEAHVEGEFICHRGVPSAVISYRARSVDFLVVGNAGLHKGAEHVVSGSTIEAVLRCTSRPVLVVPDEPVGDSTVVIAYDGSRASERALAAGAEFAAVCEIDEVHLLTVGMPQEETEELQAPAKEYLTSYGLRVTGVCEQGKAADVIYRYGKEVDASVVVLGAFGSNRVKEVVFGSTTRKVLSHGDSAALLVA